ncbi:MAG: DUF3857 domain-containing protein [Bacteroidales bacterium]|nr:DUF3857 domain-containing protein [Bacteroidales bacterium]
MKKIFIIISVLVFSSVFAQNDNADAIFEKITKTYTLNEDGSMSYRYFKQLKLLTHTAFNRFYGETFIVYNPDFQELKINETYTIMANGRKITAPDNAFNEVLPRNATHSAAFNHLREMVVTHTGLELGATIYLDYTLTTKAGFMPALMGNEIIEESSPVELMEIIVSVPTDVELQHQMFNLRTAPEIMVIGNAKVYTWQFKGLKASGKESFRGDLPGTPRLTFSNEAKGAVVIEWISRQKAFDYLLNEEMEKFVSETKIESDELGTLLAIQEEVVKNMKYDHVPMDWVGYRVRTPVEVWQSNGGNALEKAVLLTSLLKAADFNAVPVLISPQRFYDKNAGNLLLFNNLAVQVNTKGHGTLYLSPTETSSQSMEPLLAGDVLVPLYKNADFSTSEVLFVKNGISLTGKFEISRDMTLTGLIETELTGAANPFLEIQKENQQLAQKVSGGLIAKTDGAVKIINSNSAKTEAQLKVEKTEACKETLGFYKMELPAMNNGFESWHISYLSSERKDVFVPPFALEEKYAFEIEIPEGFESVNKKIAVSVKNKAGSVKIEISPKNNKISVKRELVLNSKEISVQDYADFRAIVNEWLDENMKLIVFKKAVDSGRQMKDERD